MHPIPSDTLHRHPPSECMLECGLKVSNQLHGFVFVSELLFVWSIRAGHVDLTQIRGRDYILIRVSSLHRPSLA